MTKAKYSPYTNKIINETIRICEFKIHSEIVEHINNTINRFRMNETNIKIFIDDESGVITFYESLFDEIKIEIPECILKKISTNRIRTIIENIYTCFEEEIFIKNCRSAYIVTYRNGKRDRDLRLSILDC